MALHVLLIDDDPGSLKAMAIALRLLKHSCDALEDPQEAINHYRKHAYDLVITDVCMPIMSGFALAAELRAINPEAKIIFMSGQATQRADEHFDDAVKIALRKPIDFATLRKVLEEIGTKGKKQTEEER